VSSVVKAFDFITTKVHKGRSSIARNKSSD
jgi:hypothetical protein